MLDFNQGRKTKAALRCCIFMRRRALHIQSEFNILHFLTREVICKMLVPVITFHSVSQLDK
jgi:hypothetical protein